MQPHLGKETFFCDTLPFVRQMKKVRLQNKQSKKNKTGLDHKNCVGVDVTIYQYMCKNLNCTDI